MDNYLGERLQSKHNCEEVVGPLHGSGQSGRLIVPGYSHGYCVSDYAKVDCFIEGGVANHLLKKVNDSISGRDTGFPRNRLVAVAHYIAVLDLERSERVLSIQFLLFQVEVVDYHTNKQIQQENTAQNHNTDKE